MSKYVEFETQYGDRDCLVDALKSMGYNPKVHEKAVPLLGIGGDQRKETAEIVIPRQQVGSLSNEIGFKLQADGTYKRISSEYDNNSNRLPESKLTRAYAEKKVLKDAAGKGLKMVDRIAAKDGGVRFVFEPARTESINVMAGLR